MYKRGMEGSPVQRFASQGPSAEDEITRRLQEMSLRSPERQGFASLRSDERQGFASHRRMLPSGRNARYTLGRLTKPNFSKKKKKKKKKQALMQIMPYPSVNRYREEPLPPGVTEESLRKVMFDPMTALKEALAPKGGRRARTRKARRASRNPRGSSRRK